MRLIDATRIEQYILNNCSDNEEINAIYAEIINAPTVEAEPTEEQVKEYCRKRCLVVVSSELFNEMKARWGRDNTKHGHWIVVDETEPRRYGCSCCNKLVWNISNYCPHCGAKMDGERREDETD